MNEKPNSVDSSLPRSSVKFSIRGSNYNANRVPLRQKILLGEFFGELMACVIGDEKITITKMTNEDEILIMVMSKLPEVFRAIEDQYVAIIKDCTDIDMATLENEFEIEDLVIVFKNIWKANNFTETMKSLGQATKKKT